MATIPCDNVVSLPAAESRRRAALFVNHLRNCIASCKRTLVENLQEAQSDVAGKLSQSIYWVESILSKCHEEGDLLFFTIRTDSSHVSEIIFKIITFREEFRFKLITGFWSSIFMVPIASTFWSKQSTILNCSLRRIGNARIRWNDRTWSFFSFYHISQEI